MIQLNDRIRYVHLPRVDDTLLKCPALYVELERRALPASRALIRIVPATLGVDAPLLGAAELAFEPLLGDPKAWARRRTILAELASA